MTSTAAGPGVVERPVEPALLEGEHDDAERRRQRQRVHQQRLERQQDRAGEQEEQHERRRRRRAPITSGAWSRRLCLLVDEARGVARHEHRRAGGRRSARISSHGVLRRAAERRPVEREVGVGDVAGRAHERRAARDARRPPRSGARARAARRRSPAADGDGDRLGDVARVVARRRRRWRRRTAGRRGTASALGPVSDGRAAAARRRASSSAVLAERDRDRAAHDAAREPVPAAGLVGHRRPAADRQRVDARAERAPAATGRRAPR